MRLRMGWPYTYYDQIRGQRMVSPEYGGPTGFAQRPDGSLYVSDDVGGRIWRVRYAN
jgi:glucose/arabinose dehydrogenase